MLAKSTSCIAQQEGRSTKLIIYANAQIDNVCMFTDVVKFSVNEIGSHMFLFQWSLNSRPWVY